MTSTTVTEHDDAMPYSQNNPPPDKRNTPAYVALASALVQLMLLAFTAGKIVSTLDSVTKTQDKIQSNLEQVTNVVQQLSTRVTVMEDRVNRGKDH